MVQTGADLFDVAGARSRWLAGRHALLSANIANADTPGFVPLDAVPMDRHRLEPAVMAVGLARTSPHHLPGMAPPASVTAGRRVDGWESAPSGNAVVMEEQVQKLAETQGQYRLATSVYGKYLRMVRTALGVAAG